MLPFTIIFSLFNFLIAIKKPDDIQKIMDSKIEVAKCQDFDLTGKGVDRSWDLTEWIEMNILDDTEIKFKTKFKILYSENGIYVLAECEDKMITTEYDKDQGDIWNGDVFEVFLQTDISSPLYFEYEINPLNVELAILVPNNEGTFFGWSPWHYEGERKIKKAVFIHDGIAKSGAQIKGWTAEMFFPFSLFRGLKNVPPESGTEWRGNFYRMDYDTGRQVKWSWQTVGTSFHEYEKFGSLIFK